MRWSVVVLAVALASLEVSAQDSTPDERPTTRVTSCITEGCHAERTTPRYLHGPVAAGECLVCHVYESAADHTFKLEKEGAALCEFCHAAQAHTGGLPVHEPVAEGKCLECHDPHGSEIRHLNKFPSEGELCLSCHDKTMVGIGQLHTVVEKGECTGCHAGHASGHAKLLRDEGRDLCLRCHEEAVARREGEVSFHEPLHDDCDQCHVAHGSHQPALLQASPTILCSNCHGEVEHQARETNTAHSPTLDFCGCLNCHSGHSSASPALLVAEPSETCMRCHKVAVSRPDGTLVEKMPALDRPNRKVHPPIEETGCHACHLPHSSPDGNLLIASYTKSFYQSYEPEAYELCFSCHEPVLVDDDATTEVTRFRNGDRNLHSVHVKDARDEVGHSCRVCHAVHASDGEALTHVKVTFGKWTIPIELERTPTGGACAAGCHRAREYDRETPVIYTPDEKPRGRTGGAPPSPPRGDG